MWNGLTVAIGVFLTLFGVAEVVANGYYLATGTTVSRGRKQHGDLPPTATDAQVRGKVVRMGVGGALTLACCVAAWVTGRPTFVVAAAAVVVVVLAYDAVVHRYYRSVIALAVATVLLVLAVLGTR
ncbi:MAG: hypothetical protein ACOYBY_08040 [Dermatophilaceae bacterium]